MVLWVHRLQNTGTYNTPLQIQKDTWHHTQSATDKAGHIALHSHMMTQTWQDTTLKVIQTWQDTWHHSITWCYRHGMPQGTTVINCFRHGMTYGITLSHYCGHMLHILMQHTALHKSISLYFNWVRTSSMTASSCWQGWVKMNSNCKTSQRSSADCCICSSEKLRTW